MRARVRVGLQGTYVYTCILHHLTCVYMHTYIHRMGGSSSQRYIHMRPAGDRRKSAACTSGRAYLARVKVRVRVRVSLTLG